MRIIPQSILLGALNRCDMVTPQARDTVAWNVNKLNSMADRKKLASTCEIKDVVDTLLHAAFADALMSDVALRVRST